MPHAIYSGEGEYNSATLMAVYKAYLPKEYDEKYEFKTDTIYNLSCKDYPNRILMFMRLVEVQNTDLTNYTADGTTTDEPQTILFSLNSAFIQDISLDVEPLDFTKDISLVLFHDAYYDISYVKDYLACSPNADFETGPVVNDDEQLESPVMIMPKRGMTGLVVKKIK